MLHSSMIALAADVAFKEGQKALKQYLINQTVDTAVAMFNTENITPLRKNLRVHKQTANKTKPSKKKQTEKNGAGKVYKRTALGTVAGAGVGALLTKGGAVGLATAGVGVGLPVVVVGAVVGTVLGVVASAVNDALSEDPEEDQEDDQADKRKKSSKKKNKRKEVKQ